MNPTPRTLLERLDARILWNCAFNDPDEDTQLLMEAAKHIRFLNCEVGKYVMEVEEYEFKMTPNWDKLIEDIFVNPIIPKDF